MSQWYIRRANKYGAKKTEYMGRKFDSKLEAGVAHQIEMMKKAGEVIEIEYQKTFPLYAKNGTKICTHRVDFLLTMKDGSKQVIEAKGFATPVWEMKAAMFADNYPEIPYYVYKK